MNPLAVDFDMLLQDLIICKGIIKLEELSYVKIALMNNIINVKYLFGWKFHKRFPRFMSTSSFLYCSSIPWFLLSLKYVV